MPEMALSDDAREIDRRSHAEHGGSQRFNDRALVEEIISALKSGEEHRARELYQRIVELYQNRIFALAFSVVKAKEDAEDVVQESFVKAYLSLHDFRGASSFYTWLYRIVFNMAVDLRRRTARRGGAPQEFFDEKTSSDGETALFAVGRIEDPQQALVRKEQRSKLESVLNELSEEHRVIVILREVDGHSYDEIAETLGISKGTVMSRLFYARKRMQSLLKEYAPPGVLPEE